MKNPVFEIAIKFYNFMSILLKVVRLFQIVLILLETNSINLYYYYQLIVLGDFNLPNILWFPNDDSFGLLPSCTIP